MSWALKYYKSIAFWPLPCSYRLQTAASLEFSGNLKHAWNLCDVSLWKFSFLVAWEWSMQIYQLCDFLLQTFLNFGNALESSRYVLKKSVSKIDHYWVYTIYPQTCLALDLDAPWTSLQPQFSNSYWSASIWLMSTVKSEDGNLKWQGLGPLGKFTMGFSFTCLEVEISPRLQDESESWKLIGAWFSMCGYCRCLARCGNKDEGAKSVKVDLGAIGGISGSLRNAGSQRFYKIK